MAMQIRPTGTAAGYAGAASSDTAPAPVPQESKDSGPATEKTPASKPADGASTEQSVVLHGDPSAAGLALVTQASTPANQPAPGSSAEAAATSSQPKTVAVAWRPASASFSFSIFIDWRNLMKYSCPPDSLKQLVYRPVNLLQFNTWPPIDQVTTMPQAKEDRHRVDHRHRRHLPPTLVRDERDRDAQ